MMRPFKKSSRRQQRYQARTLSTRFSSLESLENRALLTGTGFEVDAVPVGHADTAEVSSTAQDQQRVQRIVNGQQTSDHESVGIVNNGCSGTLIAPNAVLTAAHCIPDDSSEPQDFQVGGKTYDVARVVVHPDYGSRDIDLAVMILKDNVTDIEPSEINRTAPQVGQMLTLVGFGGTGTAQGGHNGDFGVKHVGTTPLDELTETGVNWNFDNANEANTAPGDSGGPAFIDVNGKLVVAGVTSGGTQDNAGLGDYSFDTRVDTFADWIDGVVAGGDGGNSTPGDDIDEPGDGNPTDEEPGDEDPIDDSDPIDDLDQEEAIALAEEELEYYDSDGNGAISESELVDELLDYGLDSGEANDEASYLMDLFDENGDGELSFEELVVSYGGAEDAGDVVTDDSEGEDDLGDLDDDDWGDEDLGGNLGDEDPIGEDDGSDVVDDTSDDEYEMLYGDADGDGWVGFGDFLVFSSNFGDDQDMSFEDGDFNGDGYVGFDDFLGLSQNFGYGPDDGGSERTANNDSVDHVFAELCEDVS